jgi:hypothetical protein
MLRLLIGILVVAAVSTAGDYIWYEHNVRHRLWVGVLHGAALLTAVGAVLGAATNRPLAGLPIGAIAGVAGALTYYALATIVSGGIAMLVAWGALWIVLGVLDGRLVRRGRRSLSQSLVQGTTAAILSGLTFFLVVGGLWGRAPSGGRNYALQFAMWCIAWAPGILAIGQDLRRPPSENPKLKTQP